MLLPLLCCVTLAGCSSVSYYTQSVVGHSRLMMARKPVKKVIETAEPELAQQLGLALEIRRYAVTELALPDNKSYQSYVALDREFPVWTVVAAPAFSLDAKQWCYPVIGCASYRGYFKLKAAERYAEGLQKKGLETYVGGATAYSTLGYFADPLLPSMLRYGDTELAETLFHELAHQVLYVNGDSDFNEAFASVVGEQGTLRWLRSHNPALVPAYQNKLAALNQFSLLLKSAKETLSQAYSKDVSESDKAAIKQQLFQSLRDDYERLKTDEWNGKPWFDGWFEKPLNNARLAAFSTYREKVPELEALLGECDGNFERFYQRLKQESEAGEGLIEC